MAKQAQLYIWRKLVSRTSLAELELQLQVLLDGTYAVIEHVHRQRLTIEAVAHRAEAQRLQEQFGGMVERLPRDWQAQLFAAAKLQPLRIGRRLVISSDAGGGAETLVIPAGAAFGTGEHATTAMSLRMLERVSRRLAPGWRMLDAGTGSGILALAGERFGAGKVVAIENDPLALATARQNAQANGSSCVAFVRGDVRRRTRDSFEVITANLYSELLAEVLPLFRHCVAPGGTLILSGVMRQQEPELTRALGANGFQVQEARRRGKWVALRCSAISCS